MNPFTDESRDARLNLAIKGVFDTLRAPESLHRLVMLWKPADRSAGDFALKSMLDQVLIAMIMRGDYRGLQSTLGTLFGDPVPSVPDKVPGGTSHAERHKEGRK